MSASASPLSWPPAPAERSGFWLGRERVQGTQSSVDWMMKRGGLGARSGWEAMLAYAALSALSLGLASSFGPRDAGATMSLAWCGVLLTGWLVGAWVRHAADRECIALQGGLLTVEHVSGSHVERVEFQSAWVRVEPEHGDRSLIELSGQGRRIAVGRYVRPEQRRLLAEELRLALRRWHAGAADRHRCEFGN